MPRGEEKVVKFQRMRDLFSSDGRSLFEYHATASADAMLEHLPGSSERVDAVATLWDALAAREKDFWQHNTAFMSSALSRGLLNGLDHLKLGNATKRSIEYGEQIKGAFENFGNIGATADAPEQSSRREAGKQVAAVEHRSNISDITEPQQHDPLIATPVLDFLYRGTTIGIEPDIVIETVLQSIAELIRDNADMKLRVRHTGMWINYDPSASDVTSIAVRLRTAINRSLTVKRASEEYYNLQSHLEWVLRPLAYINRYSAAFAGLNGVVFALDETEKYTGRYRSSCEWLRSSLNALSAIRSENKDNVVTAVMQAVRDRAKKMVCILVAKQSCLSLTVTSLRITNY